MINCGLLNRKITILKPHEVLSNGLGTDTIDYVPSVSVYATIKPVRGQEYYKIEKAQDSSYYTITIRYRKDVDTQCKVRYGDLVFDIDSVVDTMMMHESLELYCSRRAFGGVPADSRADINPDTGSSIKFK